MGAGASAQAAHLFAAESAVDPQAEWRSENARELDRLGGYQRPALKRGQSMKFRLEWLKVALHEQGDRLEEALAKDPLAGRHEIMRQEAVKIARTVASNNHHFTVRQWQTMRHTDLRAQQAREELDRKLRDRSGQADGDRPVWNNLHWAHSPKVAGANGRRGQAASTAAARRTPSRVKFRGLSSPTMAERAAGRGGGHQSEFAEHDSAAEEELAELEAEGPLDGPDTAPSELSQTSFTTTLAAYDEKQLPEPLPPPRPLALARAPEAPAEWRLRVLRAKRKAMLIISVVLAFRGRKYRTKGLQRLDSLSYFIAQHLGPELPRFVEEQGLYRATKDTAADLQALAEEIWQEQNYIPFPDDGDQLDPANALLPVSALPSSPRLPLSGLGSPISNGAAAASAGGTFKQPPAPLLRLPHTVTAGGATAAAVAAAPPSAPPAPPATAAAACAAAAAAGARSGSPLLRSRPVNLTPTLHHIPQAGTSTGGPTSPTPPGTGGGAASAQRSTAAGVLHAPHTGSSAAPVPAPPPAAANGTAATTAAAGAGGAASAGAGTAAAAGLVSPPVPRSLPVLRHSSSRMSTMCGLDADSGAAPGAHGAGSTAHTNSRGYRFSAPGSEPLIVTGPGGGPTLVRQASIDNGLSDIGTAAAAGGPAAGLAGNSKRWSSPRFSRRGGGGDKLEGAAPTTGRRGLPIPPLPLADDMSVAPRADSWAGPLNGAATRGLANDGQPGSPKAAAAASGGSHTAPAPPVLPSPFNRNPRNRRESGLILTGCTSTASLPQPARMRSPTNTADGGVTGPAPVVSATAGRALRYGSGSPGRRLSRGGSPGRPVSRSGSTVRVGASRRRGTRIGSSSADPLERPSTVPTTASERLLSSSISIRRMVKNGKSDELYQRYQEEAAALEKPLRMMQLYANRANARWVEELSGASPSVAHSGSSSSMSAGTNGGAAAAVASPFVSGPSGPGWEPPHVHDASRLNVAVGGAQAGVFRAEVVAMLRAGKMAVQVLAGDDTISLGSGQLQPLWGTDPWELIAAAFPARAAAAEHVRRITMGPRVLMALVMAVEALAGAEAVARLVVVLHINDMQQEAVMQELRHHKFCGLRPDNIILLVQKGRQGYLWNPEQSVFIRDETSPAASAGTGYAIMQLVWPEEAFKLPPNNRKSGIYAGASRPEPSAWLDAAGGRGLPAPSQQAANRLVPLGSSVLNYLAQRGVEWLLTRRLRDISLYHPDMTLDPDVIAYSLYLHELLGANMSVQVEMVDSVSAAKAAQSGVVLAPPRVSTPARRAASSGATAGGKLGSVPPRRAGTSVATPPPLAAAGPLRTISDVVPGSHPEGGGGSPTDVLHSHIVVDVKGSDTATPRTLQLLNEVRARAKGRLAVSTRRYMWRVDVLQSLIQRSSLFHPSLEVAGELAYLTFDMADITAATDCGARCVALSARHPARSLNSVADLEDFMGAVVAQDKHAPFRRLAGNISSVYGPSERAGARSVSPTHGRGSAAAAAGIVSPCRLAGATGRSSSPTVPREPRGRHPSHRIVVFVADNEATSLAVQLLLNMVKPGRDYVVLVTVVSSVLQEAAARMLLKRHEMTLAKSLVEVATEMLHKDAGSSLVDQLELYCEQADPHLVVMGSQMMAAAAPQALTSVMTGAAAGGGGAAIAASGGAAAGGGGGAGAAGSGRSGAGMFPMGSVVVSMLRNASRPMLVVKATAKNANMMWEKDKLRVLVEVTHSSRALMRYVCSKLVSQTRLDRVFLVRGGTKETSHQDSNASRRLLENFAEIASQHNLPVVKRALEEPFETGAVKYAENDKVNVIAVQAPAGRGIPNNIFNIISSSRSAVFIHKEGG